MTSQYASAAAQQQLERRVRSVATETAEATAWTVVAEQLMNGQRSAMALGATGVSILLGGTADVVVAWPDNPDGSERFVDSAGSPLDYEVDIVATGLLGKGSYVVLAQTTSTVTVRITATVLIAVGTQFIVYGRTKFA